MLHAVQNHYFMPTSTFMSSVCNKSSKISKRVLTLAHPVWCNTHGAVDISRAWIKWLMTNCNDPSLHILKSHLREMKAESDRWTLSLSSFYYASENLCKKAVPPTICPAFFGCFFHFFKLKLRQARNSFLKDGSQANCGINGRLRMC